MAPQRPLGKPTALDESLTDAEYDRLAAILRRFQGEDAMNLEEMDGFSAALSCGPVTILPNVYLDEIWGGETAPFDGVDDFNEFLDLAMRHWNFMARELLSQDTIFIPCLDAEKGEDLPNGNRWARGFLRGIALCREGWDEIFADEDKFAMLLSVMALAHENDPDPEMRTWKTPPDPELRKQVLTGLAVSTQRRYDYFRPYREQEAGRGTVAGPQTRRKIRRNEACYGSGKKYKYCCGNVTIN